MIQLDWLFKSINFYLKNPGLVLEALMDTMLFLFSLVVVIGFFISVWINPYLDEFETFDLNMHICYYTGYYPGLLIFM